MWFEARENQYLSASGEDFMPFSAFDEEKAEFSAACRERYADSPYDRYMFAVISGKITERQKLLNEKE